MRLAVQADEGYTPLKLNDQNVEFLSEVSPLCLNMLLIKLIKTSVDIVLLIMCHQRHILAL